ncbi:MAG TPA: thioredoxin family protein [Ramlibacter sp.]|nr:thioredoxin family protein [Ramlibacter sp.]
METWWVVCLCAEWCGVCREWRAIFDEAAAAHPEFHFAWVDVEDEAQAMGDTDIETFPTILVARGDSPRFFGPVQPSLAQLNRLIASLTEDPSSREVAAAVPLLARLRTAVLLNL